MAWKTAPAWRTLLLALLLSSGATTAFVADARELVQEEHHVVVPLGNLTLPAPKIGDAATYHWVEVDATGNHTMVREDTFRFLEPIELPDLDGELRVFDRLDVPRWGGLDGRPGAWKSADVRVEFVDVRQHRVAGRLLEGPSPDGFDGCSTSCPEDEADFRRVVEHTQPAYFGRTPCFLFSPLQGRTTDLEAGPVVATHACGWFRDGMPPVAALERVPANGTDLIVLAGYDLVHEVWLQEGLAYPVRVVFQDSDSGMHAELRLASFAAGDRPLASRSGVVPELPRAALGPLGPSEEGFAATFPLSEAFRVGIDHEDGSPARQFMTRSAAYVAAADRTHTVYDEGRHDTTWTMLLADGSQAMWLNVTRHVGPPRPAGLVELPTEPETTDTLATATASAAGLPSAADRFPAPAVATLLERWQRAGGDAADTWGFRWHTSDGLPRLDMWAGHQTRYRDAGGPTVVVGPVDLDEERPVGEVEDLVIASLDALSASISFYQNAKARHPAGEPVAASHPQAPVDPPPPTPQGKSVEVRERTVWTAPPAEAVAGAGLFILLVTAIHHFFPGLLGLFSRVNQHDALDHPVRRRVHSLVSAEPGIHFSDLVARCGSPRSTVRFHARKLAELGLIKTRSQGGYLCHYPARATQANVAAGPLLRSRGARRIASALAAAPGLSVTDLAGAAGVRVSTAHYHLERMQRAGLVRLRREGGRVAVFPASGSLNAARNA